MVFFHMEAIDKIKIKLSQFFQINIDRSVTVPIKIYERKGNFYLLFKNKKTAKIYEVIAKSTDGFSFEACENKTDFVASFDFPNAVVLDNFDYHKQKVMFFGERSINIAFSKDEKTWQIAPKPVIISSCPTQVGNVFFYQNSLIILYYKKVIKNKLTSYSAFLGILDNKNPEHLLWKTDKPIWTQEQQWMDKKIAPLGAVYFKGEIITYWYLENLGIFGVIFSDLKLDIKKLKKNNLELKKHFDNPIISPKEKNSWEAFNTFNPAALYIKGKVHILYRAQGFDYVSSIGYASSTDGFCIEERGEDPIFMPTMDFENNQTGLVNHDFVSGGGIGGCEDPRLTKINNKIYMIYVAFDGWSSPRLAMTSILLEDFLNKKWLWSKPVLISPPGVVDKSGCLLPEKINGKYVFFHRIFPNILIDFVDDLNFDGKTKWLKSRYQIKIRPDKWDSRKIGAGAPPLKTKYGWLLIYYGVDDRAASKYHIGAMILDLKNPTKVLYRTDEPILQPSALYENTGFKPGIAYPCGAVIMDDQLLVYYGAADSVVCVATAKLEKFLEELKSKKPVHLYNVKISKIYY